MSSEGNAAFSSGIPGAMLLFLPRAVSSRNSPTEKSFGYEPFCEFLFAGQRLFIARISSFGLMVRKVI